MCRGIVAKPSSGGTYSSSRRLYHMALIQKFLVSLRRDDEEGQGLAEYALILALIAIIAIVALIFLGGQVSTILSKVGASI
jgi:pilus assembly protein Flp/PilA